MILTLTHKLHLWAKRKSGRNLPWPGIVSDPGEYQTTNEKHFITFYGSYNHAWIGDGDGDMWPYEEYRDMYMITEEPPQGFKEAVERAERVLLSTRMPSKDQGGNEKIEANGGFASADNRSSATGEMMQPGCSAMKPKPRKLSHEEQEVERVTKFFKTVKPELFPTSDEELTFRENVKHTRGMQEEMKKLSDAELLGFMEFLCSDSEEPDFDNTPIDLAALCDG